MQEQRNKREEVVPGKRRVRENLLLLAKANLFLNYIAHFPPLAARDGKPNQVQCCTHPEATRELDALPGPKKEINPTFVGLISFWNPATSYSPGPSPAKYHRR